MAPDLDLGNDVGYGGGNWVELDFGFGLIGRGIVERMELVVEEVRSLTV